MPFTSSKPPLGDGEGATGSGAGSGGTAVSGGFASGVAALGDGIGAVGRSLGGGSLGVGSAGVTASPCRHAAAIVSAIANARRLTAAPGCTAADPARGG